MRGTLGREGPRRETSGRESQVQTAVHLAACATTLSRASVRPERLQPRRWLFESRPLREVPVPFLCAMRYQPPFAIPRKRPARKRPRRPLPAPEAPSRQPLLVLVNDFVVCIDHVVIAAVGVVGTSCGIARLALRLLRIGVNDLGQLLRPALPAVVPEAGVC